MASPFHSLTELYLATNGLIAACYLSATFLLGRSLVISQHAFVKQPLSVAMIGVVFSCALNHLRDLLICSVNSLPSLPHPPLMDVGLSFLNVIAAIAFLVAYRRYNLITATPELLEQTERQAQQIQALQQLNQTKDDFLSAVTHELRTPLSSIKMALQLVKTTALEERRQQYLSILEQECDRGCHLIEDLLNLQQLEAVNQECEALQSLCFEEWLPKLLQPVWSRTHLHQQSLEVHLAPHLPDLIVNRPCLERVLSELLTNACKYTPATGKIVLTACPTSNASVIFTVSNQAEIPVSELPHIFDKFYRIPNADPNHPGGTGLGLALVKRLVKTLGGEIWVSSQQGMTNFLLELPSTDDCLPHRDLPYCQLDPNSDPQVMLQSDVLQHLRLGLYSPNHKIPSPKFECLMAA